MKDIAKKLLFVAVAAASMGGLTGCYTRRVIYTTPTTLVQPAVVVPTTPVYYSTPVFRHRYFGWGHCYW